MASRYTVPEDVEDIIDRLVGSGSYGGADEVIRTAMLALEMQESQTVEISAELWAAIEEAQARAERLSDNPGSRVLQSYIYNTLGHHRNRSGGPYAL